MTVVYQMVVECDLVIGFGLQGDQDGCVETLDFINPKGVRFIPKKEGEII